MSFICIESHELIFVALVAYFEMQSDYCDSPGKDRTDALWVIMVPPHKEHLLFAFQSIRSINFIPNVDFDHAGAVNLKFLFVLNYANVGRRRNLTMFLFLGGSVDWLYLITGQKKFRKIQVKK